MGLVRQVHVRVGLQEVLIQVEVALALPGLLGVRGLHQADQVARQAEVEEEEDSNLNT